MRCSVRISEKSICACRPGYYRRQAGVKRRFYSVGDVASVLGYSRQYYYKHCKCEQAKAVIEDKVLAMVQCKRKILPCLGVKKLYHQIHSQLSNGGIKFGRDKLFTLLANHGLLIKRKRHYTQTTMSRHWLRKYPNLIKTIEVTVPEQVWVSDITYVKTDEGNCYLNMVTDAYSRKIVGYAVSSTMSSEAMSSAYRMALKNRVYPETPLIHHSDRGLQYCSQEYVRLSNKNRVKISMTENGDPYENALAERMNRTMKEEFGLGRILPSLKIAEQLVEESVELYNNQRPHWALKLKTPNQVHLQKIPAQRATGIL